jgi:hypothetical protein
MGKLGKLGKFTIYNLFPWFSPRPPVLYSYLSAPPFVVGCTTSSFNLHVHSNQPTIPKELGRPNPRLLHPPLLACPIIRLLDLYSPGVMPVRYQNSSLSLDRRDAPKSIDLGGAVPRSLLPISPPETDRVVPSLVTDSRQPHSHNSSLSFHDGLQVTPPTATGETSTRYRRSPSVPYMQSGLQSRTNPAPNRPSRWLVLVMPPSSLNSEPTLGQTLSTGPPGRFQSGILMPLFPTVRYTRAPIAVLVSQPPSL